MRERSPITWVANVTTPTLILVGDDDARTPIAQSRAWYTSLESLGVPVEFVHYPREGHGLREPRHRSDSLQRALAWFDRWIP
jgi:dipeptidyl aminopeptidase/acylaminoacyl peptidase